MPALRRAFVGELLFEVLGGRRVDQPARVAQGGCRRAPQPLAQGLGFGLQFAIGDAAPDQAPLLGLRGIDPLAEQCDAQRAAAPEQAGQQSRGAEIGHGAEL